LECFVKFAHLIGNGHSLAPMGNVMEILRVTNKENMTNTLEIFYMYNVTRHDDQINEKDTVQHNVIFDTLIHNNPHTNSLSITLSFLSRTHMRRLLTHNNGST
jgi:hypothetical protein